MLSGLMLTASTIRSENNADQWFLMARHGECASIQSLKRKVPEMDNIEEPQLFIQLMKDKGFEVTSSVLAGLSDMALQVRVPEKGLSLMFVKGAMCTEYIDKK